jgi:hypothetical protein
MILKEKESHYKIDFKDFKISLLYMFVYLFIFLIGFFFFVFLYQSGIISKWYNLIF